MHTTSWCLPCGAGLVVSIAWARFYWWPISPSNCLPLRPLELCPLHVAN